MSTFGQSPRPSFSFNGLKFWISLFAPQRIKALVKKHNGIVVQSESDADVLILDPKRAATRSGISHVWVEDCIRNGRRIDEERYLVVPPSPREQAQTQAQTQAPARSSSALQTTPRRRQRNFFTPADDRTLIEWLRKEQRIAARNNVTFNASGNTIYKNLAALHPNHSFHSWRDRWIRHLSRIVSLDNRPSQPSPSPEPPSAAAPPPSRPRVARQRAQVPVRAEDPVEEQAPVHREALAEVAASAGGRGARAADAEEHEAEPVQLFFMQKHHYYIVKRTYQHSLAAQKGRAQSEAEFFESLHETYPSLSPDDWREEYWKIKSWYENGLSQDNSCDAGAPGEVEAAPPVANEEAPAASVDAAQPAETAQNGNTAQEVQAQEQEPAVDADLDLDDDAILDGINSQIDKQQEFLGKLEVYNDYTGVYVPPSFFIGGRYIETCSLWLAVEEQGVSLEDVDWGKIAESLGFNEADHPSLWKQLAGWFHQNLKQFNKLLEQMVNEAEGEEEEEDEDEAEDEGEEAEAAAATEAEDEGEEAEAAAATEASGGGDGELSVSQPLPQQKPMGIFSSAKKRLLAIAFPNSDPAYHEADPSSPSKRVRFSGMPTTTDDAESDDGDDDDDFEPPSRTRSAAHRTPAEPETQDFAYSK